MTLADLSKVTETLRSILMIGIGASKGWPPAISFKVSPLPPDRLQNTGTDLGLYLYHIAEDAHFKNPAPTGGGPASRPLALKLYYQLTAQVGTEDTNALRAQLLIGCAVKVLHDHPNITDAETIVAKDGTVHRILEEQGLAGQGNRLRVTLRPVPVDDAVDYWTAGEAPLRLAAYYEVSVVLLEYMPEPSVAPPVLSYGSGVFATGAPILTGSRATLSIRVGTDATPRLVEVQPAQVSLGERFELTGTSLAGESTTLQLRDRAGSKQVDPSLWAIVASSEYVQATPTSALEDTQLIPGTWLASVAVRKSMPGGGGVVTHTSNETPIVIAPAREAALPPGPTLGTAAAGSTVEWKGWGFADARIPKDAGDPDALRLYVGGERLALDVGGGLAPGEYQIVDSKTLRVALPADLAPGPLVAVRVAVRGAFSAPRWLGIVP